MRVLKELSENWHFGIVWCDDRMDDRYGTIIKIVEFEKENKIECR